MNHENMRLLADKIEFEDRFDYAKWLYIPRVRGDWDDGDEGDHSCSAEHAERLNECGTAGCVAGWAAHLAIRDGLNPQGKTVFDLGKEWLELNEEGQAYRLFFAEVLVGHEYGNRDAAMTGATAVEIAKVLRQIADGDRVL